VPALLHKDGGKALGAVPMGCFKMLTNPISYKIVEMIGKSKENPHRQGKADPRQRVIIEARLDEQPRKIPVNGRKVES